jgi:hypothetical protein
MESIFSVASRRGTVPEGFGRQRREGALKMCWCWTKPPSPAMCWTNRFNELRRRGVPKFNAAVAAGSPTGFWRMSGHPAVQQALRNRYFDSLGLPRLRRAADGQGRDDRPASVLKLATSIRLDRGLPPPSYRTCWAHD